jgi:hypothetical protein
MQSQSGILLKRRGAEAAERRGGEAGESHQKVSADVPSQTLVSLRSLQYNDGSSRKNGKDLWAHFFLPLPARAGRGLR